MNKVLVICKGTGQSKSFERFMDDYTKKNNLPIEWIYANDKEYLDVIEGGIYNNYYDSTNNAIYNYKSLIYVIRLKNIVSNCYISYYNIQGTHYK